VDEGRDYTLDAPAPIKLDTENDETPRNLKKNTPKVDVVEVIIPVVKSPAQVAAEKAAEWKRQ
jgi:hypothetical protein